MRQDGSDQHTGGRIEPCDRVGPLIDEGDALLSELRPRFAGVGAVTTKERRFGTGKTHELACRYLL